MMFYCARGAVLLSVTGPAGPETALRICVHIVSLLVDSNLMDD